MVCDYLCIQVNRGSWDFCRVAKLGKISGQCTGGVHRISLVQLELRNLTGGQAYEIPNVVVSGGNRHGKRRLGAVWTSVVRPSEVGQG